jgi:imidazolonepropionase
LEAVSPVVIRAKTVVTNAARPPTGSQTLPQRAATFEELGLLRDGAIACERGTVAWTGPIDGLPQRYRSAPLHEYPDCVAVPGLVDAHSHPLFAGDREPDFSARVRGEKPPLGMLYTVKRTREALEVPQHFAGTIATRLREMARHGTTTLECKTGYALHARGELALLDLCGKVRAPDLPALVPTFLGAHVVPPEFSNEAGYVDYLIDSCLPVAGAHGAVYADAFCEPGFFSPGETQRYLLAARRNGLRLRVHCDEMAHGGAASMAAALDVDAVDHCNFITPQDVRAIVERGIVTVACPATIAYLDLGRKAPVRDLLDGGGSVALASDYNPGTSPCFNLQTVAFFGRKLFGLTAAEALYAVTLAAARSLRSGAGTLREGAPADAVVLALDSPDEFGWQFGGNLARTVYRAGVAIA